MIIYIYMLHTHMYFICVYCMQKSLQKEDPPVIDVFAITLKKSDSNLSSPYLASNGGQLRET